MLPTKAHRAPGMSRIDFDLDTFFPGLADIVHSRPAAAPADLYESEDGYTLKLDLPGYLENEVDVTLDRGVLTITGSPAEADEVEGRTYHVRERRHRRFTRKFALPASVRAEAVEAKLDEGVLTVQLPKSPEAKPHRVSVARATK